jgi:hypothetical protein
MSSNTLAACDNPVVLVQEISQQSGRPPRTPQSPILGMIVCLALLALLVAAAVLPFFAVSALSTARPLSAEKAVFESLRGFAYSGMFDSMEMFDGETDVSVSWKGAKPQWHGNGQYEAILTLKGPLPDHFLSPTEMQEHNTFLNEFRQRRLTTVTMTRSVHVVRDGLGWKVLDMPSSTDFFADRERAFLSKGQVNGVAFQSSDGVYYPHDGYYSVIRDTNSHGESMGLLLLAAGLCAGVGATFRRTGPLLGGIAAVAALSTFMTALSCVSTLYGASFLTGVTFG